MAWNGGLQANHMILLYHTPEHGRGKEMMKQGDKGNQHLKGDILCSHFGGHDVSILLWDLV